MAAPRKSAQQLAAREKARAKAAALTERHEKLIDLAAEFFEQQEQADFIRTDARQKADALLAKAEADAESAVLRAAEKVRAMLDAGEGKAAVAARLGLSGAEVKRMADLVERRAGAAMEPVEEPAEEMAAEEVEEQAA
jgi:endonuclease/exonuclease/phosphatase (EEP) superfamily protein YafD